MLIGSLYSDALGVLVYVRIREGRRSWSPRWSIQASSSSSSSAPIYALSHFNQRSVEEAAAGRARFIKLSSILRERGREKEREGRRSDEADERSEIATTATLNRQKKEVEKRR